MSCSQTSATSGIPDAGCPAGEQGWVFQDGTTGCACQIADPDIGSVRSGCVYNPTLDGGGANVICDPLTLHCRLPRDLEPCSGLASGPQNLCDVGYTCVTSGDAGAPVCVQLCTTSADCQNPQTKCVAGAASVDGGAPTSACLWNVCDGATNPYGACDSVGTNDGQCLPYPSGSGLSGLCTRLGVVPPGQPCAPTGGECSVCAKGGICGLGGSADPRDTCLPACDGTGGSPSCPSPSVCAPFADHGTTTPNPGVCEPAPVSSSYPAPHPAFPQIPNGGGPRLTTPEAVVITYANYTDPTRGNRAAVESYMSSLVQSSWLTTVGADYGVGLGTVDLVELTTNAPGAGTNPNQIGTDLCNLIKNPPANFPQPNANTVYMFFYPASTTFTDGSCSSYLGDHYYTSGFTGADSVCNNVAYAVVMDCPVYPQYGEDYTDLENVETTASHELIEAATDPFLSGYTLTDYYDPWIASGGEVADMCWNDLVYEPFGVVQRIWSNTAAAAGNTSPCVPEPTGEPFTMVTASPTTVQLGTNKTFDFTVTGWSDQAVQPFIVYPFVYDSGGTAFTYSLDTFAFTNGQTGKLSVTVPAGATRGSYVFLMLAAGNPGASQDIENWVPIVVCTDYNSCPY